MSTDDKPTGDELVQLLAALIDVARFAQEGWEAGSTDADALEDVRRAGLEIGELAKKLRISELGPGANLETTVRRAILDELLEGDTALDTIANRLGLSPRVLQGRLRAAGTTYNELLDEVRSQVAKRHLARAELSLLDVAILVGYSDASAFHRAFKRWTGQTPGEYRDELAESG